LKQILKKQTKGLKLHEIGGSALTALHEMYQIRGGVETTMYDNPLDKAKEKAGKVAEDTRTAASHSVDDIKTAAKSTEEKARMEGQKIKDDAKTVAKKAGWDMK
jgi:hypothetical protein